MVKVEAITGCHDILILGECPIKWRQHPHMTTAVDWYVKHQFKQTNKQSISVHFPIQTMGSLPLCLGEHLSRPMGKPTICICENKDADQLRSKCEADQRLCFRYTDSTIPPLLNSKISSFYLFSVLVQVGLCRTCSETTLLVFPRGGSFVTSTSLVLNPQPP